MAEEEKKEEQAAAGAAEGEKLGLLDTIIQEGKMARDESQLPYAKTSSVSS